MKTILIPAVIITFLITAFNTPKSFIKAENEKSTNQQFIQLKGATHKADISNSVLTWKGFKPTGTHNGNLKLKEGAIITDKNGIKQGSFLIDMSTITVLDIPADNDSNEKLVGHLKSADFFDITTFPTASYKFSQVESKGNQKYLKGELTIKGITKSISIPVTINISKDIITLKAEPFTIDRTDFNIQYKSNKFFDNLKDKFINDEFEVGFELKLKK